MSYIGKNKEEHKHLYTSIFQYDYQSSPAFIDQVPSEKIIFTILKSGNEFIYVYLQLTNNKEKKKAKKEQLCPQPSRAD